MMMSGDDSTYAQIVGMSRGSSEGEDEDKDEGGEDSENGAEALLLPLPPTHSPFQLKRRPSRG